MQDISKVMKPFCYLLKKDVPFNFSDQYLNAFDTLNEKLTSTLVIVPPYWELPFELICDVINYAMGAVLGQCKENIFHIIYYANKTLIDAQINYAINENEMLE